MFTHPGVQLTGKAPKPIEVYCTVKKINDDWIFKVPTGDKVIDVKEELSKELVFVISCNRPEISLSREELVNGRTTSRTMNVKSTNLDNDGNIKEDSLSTNDQKEWNHYKTLVRKNVKMRFLLS